ncbi:hypothetical protein HJ526_13435 [Donghicola sp. C2-DW-16]|uniref:Helix-turn-helix domain-containing protein n=1 Tax=Donghicola mangrovi TaxID=2729614 RepID=A0ABX2PHP0_9RHOB|nr:hypothetical protein [Donghicola mangrovi]NVO28431.1 hypothetical protein [Donghicola mangrovi]
MAKKEHSGLVNLYRLHALLWAALPSMSGKDYKGDKRGKSRFVKLDYSLLHEWERLALSPTAQALFLRLCMRFNGKNNGKIYLPSREAGEVLGVTRNTVCKYYQELETKGFIVPTRRASLGLEGKGRATEWRLTHLHTPDGKGATHDYRKILTRPE